MPLVSFSDEELALLDALGMPLPPPARGAFVRHVANKLAAYPPEARGPGLVHRLAAEAQREALKSGPVAVGAGSKYDRREPRRERTNEE